jgi:hypothetical protein
MRCRPIRQPVRAGRGGASADRYRVRDGDRGRLPDLMLRFRTPEISPQCGDTGLELTAETCAEDAVIGTGAEKTVGRKAAKKRCPGNSGVVGANRERTG